MFQIGAMTRLVKGRVKCGSAVGAEEGAAWGGSAADAVHGAMIVLPMDAQKVDHNQALLVVNALRQLGAFSSQLCTWC